MCARAHARVCTFAHVHMAWAGVTWCIHAMLRHTQWGGGTRNNGMLRALHGGGSDAIQEAFLNEIFLQLAYKTYTPGEVLINFSDPPDELLIIVDGKVMVEFEHPSVQRPGIVLKEGSVVVRPSPPLRIAPYLPPAPRSLPAAQGGRQLELPCALCRKAWFRAGSPCHSLPALCLLPSLDALRGQESEGAAV